MVSPQAIGSLQGKSWRRKKRKIRRETMFFDIFENYEILEEFDFDVFLIFIYLSIATIRDFLGFSVLQYDSFFF